MMNEKLKMKPWELPVPPDEKLVQGNIWEQEQMPVVEFVQEQTASGIANFTQADWDRQGYCLWKCATLRDQVIIVVDRDIPDGAPAGYPVYSLDELSKIETLPTSTLRLINTAKKVGGAVVTKVELNLEKMP